MPVSSKNLLVVDWDFFFPRPPEDTEEAFVFYDWGHSENMMFIETLWATRAAGFLMNGKELPKVNGEWRTWWNRFKFDEDCRLYVAESNSRAVHVDVANRVSGEVWLFDAHHDCGYEFKKVREARREGRWSCEDWMVFYGGLLGQRKLHMRYPDHREAAFDEEPLPYYKSLDRKFYYHGEATPVFHTVFVCRSGAWVPPWDDRYFDQFVVLSGLPVVDVGMVEREFSMEEVDDHIRMMRNARQLWEEKKGQDE